ncbi:hypothetical protein SAMD00019534_094690, partial [Acytostelium subglobosum LB1]|uniref:hypothetical protein n=1 Tax=Acytostelium subglobosum LB1 TaxID=1410327 RepID=UPI000644F361
DCCVWINTEVMSVVSQVDCATHVSENFGHATGSSSSSNSSSANNNNKRKHDYFVDEQSNQQQQQQTKIIRLDNDKDRISPRSLATTSPTTTTTTTKKGVASLSTLCYDALIKHIDSIDSLDSLPDKLCQKLVAHHHRAKTLSSKMLGLFSHCQVTRLDLPGKDIPMDDSWLSFTQGAISSTLISVNLSKNIHISDHGLAALSCLRQLTSLDISGCDSLRGTGLIQMIEQHGHTHNHPLQKLYLQGCINLDIASCLQSLSHCQQLESLDISSIRLQDSHCVPLGRLTSIKQLDINDNVDLTSVALQHIGQLTNLLDLNISGCLNIAGSTDGGYQWLPITLQTLQASNCNIDDRAMEHIGALIDLSALSLINNPFTDIGAAHLSKLVSLTTLDLSMCTLLTDRSLEHLKSLSQISKLNLNFNSNLTDTGVAMLTGGLCDLTSLGIIGCNRLLIKVKHKPLVLLVEDNAFQVTLITKTMERYNFAVEVASNGQMALEMYKANPKYELILMDIVMPIMDGLTATMLIRDYERERGLKRTPLIMQTGNTEEGHRKVCLQAGCDDFMLKPLDKQVVYRAKELFKKDNQQQTQSSSSSSSSSTMTTTSCKRVIHHQQHQQHNMIINGGRSGNGAVIDGNQTPPACLNYNEISATASMP